MAERRRYPDTGVRPTVDPQQTSPNDAHKCQAEPTEQEEVIMSEPFIFINSFEIKESKLEDFLNAYVNEDGTEVTFVQVHPDAASLEHHQRVAHEHTRWSRRFLGVITSIQVYGTPNDVILKRARLHARSGVSVTVKPEHLGGFTRLPATPAAREPPGLPGNVRAAT